MSALEHELSARLGARLAVSRPLADLTSFRNGGPADLFVPVQTEDELMAAMAAAHRISMPAFCLGAGTNLLISDRGMRGLVVKLGDGFTKISINGAKVVAGGAAQFGMLVEIVVEHGLARLAFGTGIPGTVPSQLVINPAAFGAD